MWGNGQRMRWTQTTHIVIDKRRGRGDISSSREELSLVEAPSPRQISFVPAPEALPAYSVVTRNSILIPVHVQDEPASCTRQ